MEGGFEAWPAADGPLVRPDHAPPRDAQGRTFWVTCARPKVDRIACRWLIRRFVDPAAVFLFVPPPEMPAVADRFGDTPFDMEGTYWSHRGPLCNFDVMLDEFGLRSHALDHLALIVRGADTGLSGRFQRRRPARAADPWRGGACTGAGGLTVLRRPRA